MRPLSNEVQARIAGHIAWDASGLRLLDEDHVRRVLAAELVEWVRGLRDGDQATAAAIECAGLLRAVCAHGALAEKIPASLGPLPALDLGTRSDLDCVEYLRRCESVGAAAPALAHTSGGESHAFFALRAWAIALRAHLRGPVFLCMTPPKAELGIHNSCEGLTFIAHESPHELAREGWTRRTVFEATPPAQDEADA